MAALLETTNNLSINIDNGLLNSVVYIDLKDVRAQNFPRTDFLKLWLQVENDKTRFEDEACHRP